MRNAPPATHYYKSFPVTVDAEMEADGEIIHSHATQLSDVFVFSWCCLGLLDELLIFDQTLIQEGHYDSKAPGSATHQ